MAWLWSVFALLAGISNPLQSGSNSELVKGTQAPIVSAFIVYGIGGACLLLAIPFLGFPVKAAAAKLPSLPWWAFIGGVCNVAFLLCTLLVTKKLGSATFTTIVLVAAVTTSLALDHFGLLGFPVRHASIGRLFGAALAIAGVVCIAKF